MKINKLNAAPSVITASRVILAIIFLYLFLNNMIIPGIAVFLIAIMTDAIDGYFARKFNSSSSFGAYFDIFADFFLVIMGFLAFIIKGIYPAWILFLILLVFIQFIATSQFKVLIYDPIGKYYGAFLFAIILITVVSPSIFYNLLLIIIIIFTIISLLSRYLFFIFRKSVKE